MERRADHVGTMHAAGRARGSPAARPSDGAAAHRRAGRTRYLLLALGTGLMTFRGTVTGFLSAGFLSAGAPAAGAVAGRLAADLPPAASSGDSNSRAISFAAPSI